MLYCLSSEQLNEDKRPQNQWAFVKYSHLKKDLQSTLLALLQRLEISSSSSSSSSCPAPQDASASAGSSSSSGGGSGSGARLGLPGDLRARLAVEQKLTGSIYIYIYIYVPLLITHKPHTHRHRHRHLHSLFFNIVITWVTQHCGTYIHAEKYMSSHQHSIESCCGMSEAEVNKNNKF
jgi:hypothetical protein